MRAFVLVLLACIITVVSGSGLRDNPIVGDSATYLNVGWMASNGAKTINGNVPGDLITDMEKAKLIGDPLYEQNWLSDSALWNNAEWTYTNNFVYTPEKNANEVYLVFDGIKMGATIKLNNQVLGIVTDQFRRYTFPVLSFLRPANSQNTLSVSFPAGPGIDTNGRFMACTGGWDWAPYTNTFDQNKASTFTKGIWKDVYLVPVSTVAITNVVPQIIYAGSYPTQPLQPSTHGGFNVTVKVFFSNPRGSGSINGNLEVEGTWANSYVSQSIVVGSGDTNAVVQLPLAKGVNLWWPNGLGNATLYNFTVKFTPAGTGSTVLMTSRRIGFRAFALVTANDSNPEPLEGKDGSGSFTMKFRVNGVNVYARGANMIPMEELEGRASADAFQFLLRSAKDAHFNTLRVWGGGIFYYDVFYDTCDELGIMIYHDMMYAQQGHSPDDTPNQSAEIRHQVRRLSSHPSIVIWDGCNECGGGGIYASFVITTIAEEDQSRAVWPSSPSAGWQTGADMLWCRPDGKPLVANPSAEAPEDRRGEGVKWGSSIEEHGPYKHGSGWPAVNGDSQLRWFDANLPPSLPAPATTGPYVSGYFASEFGCVAMSSFNSMNPTLDASHWSLHAPPMYQRNYPCDNLIGVYWGHNALASLNQTGQSAFKRQLYQCLLSQALEMKSNIENRRAGNTFGTLVWQFNEIWPTGGWGSVEYGTVGYTAGQSIGGRWKPLHHFYETSVFTDITATCGSDATLCYIRNDLPSQFVGNVLLQLIRFSDGKATPVRTVGVQMDAGAAITKWFCLTANCETWDTLLPKYGCPAGVSGCVLRVTVIDSKGATAMDNLVALTNVGNMTLGAAQVSAKVGAVGPNGKEVAITVTESGQAVAMYVTLNTLASGRFSENAFMLLPGQVKQLNFIVYGDLNLALLASTLTVEHAQQYQQ